MYANQLLNETPSASMNSGRAFANTLTMLKEDKTMASTAQIFANRANARFATGPTTPQGIANCKHNATRHGLTGSQVVIKGEDPVQYDVLRSELIHQYHPANEREAMLVEEIAQNWWRLQRARRVETEVLEKYGQLECFTDPDAVKAFRTITRYLNKIERSWNQACRDLEKLQQARKAEQLVPITQASQPPPLVKIGSVSQSRHPNEDLPLSCRL
jgi:hypothetical protein